MTASLAAPPGLAGGAAEVGGPNGSPVPGKLADIERDANKWVEDHLEAKIIWRGAAIRVGHRDGEHIFAKEDWTITIEYEERA